MSQQVRGGAAPPHPPGRLPILGDVASASRDKPTQHEMQLSRTLGPIFERKLLNSRLIVVGGASLATECLDEERWARGLAGPTLNLRKIARSGLFTARTSDPLWGQAKRVLTPGFAQIALRAYHEAMDSVAADLITSWRAQPQVAVHESMTWATLEVIARAGFSQRLGLIGDRTPGVDRHGTTEFLTALDHTLRAATELSNDFPILREVRALVRGRKIANDRLVVRRWASQIVSERVKANPDASESGVDLLNLMLTTPDPETGERLPLDNVADQVLTFLVAGHETTAALLEVALHYVATRPDWAQRIYDEATERGLTYDGVAGMKATRRFLNECLRLHPPVPGFFRVARKDQDLGGVHIAAGNAVFVLALAAQRDPEVWGPTADSFDPDRVAPDRRSPAFFRPWGTGPRTCIGRAFALQEAALLLGRLVTNFELRRSAGRDTLSFWERGSLRPEPFEIIAIPRSDQEEIR